MNGWQLRLFGHFELTSPEGAGVTLPTRKTEALLALLAVNREHGLRRNELARMLWPASSIDKGLANVRQSLAAIRRVLGPESLQSTRTGCRLSDDLELQSDLDVASRRSGQVFMPGYDEPWLESIRRGVHTPPSRRTDGGVVSRIDNPVSAFLQVLEWYAEHDPAKMLALMRDNLGFVIGLNAADVRGLLTAAAGCTEHGGWRSFFEGNLIMGTGSVAIGGRQLKSLVTEAERESDNALAVQAAVQVCLSAIMQNRHSDAKQAASWCTTISAASKDTRLVPTSTQIRGAMHLHSGELQKGLQELARAEQMYRDPVDAAIMQVLQAFFLASVGESGQAAAIAKQARQVSIESGHLLVSVISELVDAMILFYEVGPAPAVQPLKQAVKLADALENLHYSIYSREILGLALLGVGEAGQYERHMARARKIRNSMSMAYTRADRQRFAAMRNRLGLAAASA